VGEPGSIETSLGYTLNLATEVIATEDISQPFTKVDSHAFQLSGTYTTPVKGLAVDASLLLVGVHWDDTTLPHFPEPGPLDDGDYHFTFTDARAGLRYQLPIPPEWFTTSVWVAGSIPTHDYVTSGLAVPGRGLKQAHFGISAVRSLTPVLPRAYIGGSYEFSFVEKVVTMDPATAEFGNRNRSDFSAQLGYFVLDKLIVNVASDARQTHGGFEFINTPLVSEAVQENHDRLLNEDILFVGGGLSYLVNAKFNLSFASRFYVAGRNTLRQNLFAVLGSYTL
jgi:hypothetical protein